MEPASENSRPAHSSKEKTSFISFDVLLLGKSGSGKGTQAQLLLDAHNVHYISSGNLLRNFAAERGPVAERLRRQLGAGGLAPTWLIFSLWLRKIQELDSRERILFDGVGRRLAEAKLLDEVLEWHRRGLVVFYLDVSDKEATRRLVTRGRLDDTPSNIKKRLRWFGSEVMPVIRHYEKRGILARVDGEGNIHEVHQRIYNFYIPSVP